MAASATAQRVFDLAMGIMGEVNENTGATDTSDNKEYKSRTLLVLNVLKGELFPFSDTYAPSDTGVRPVCPSISDFMTPIGIDDTICESVMPYGLAAHLLLDENPTAAGFFQQKYEGLKAVLKDVASGFEAIPNAYGGNAYGGFSRW